MARKTTAKNTKTKTEAKPNGRKRKPGARAESSRTHAREEPPKPGRPSESLTKGERSAILQNLEIMGQTTACANAGVNYRRFKREMKDDPEFAELVAAMRLRKVETAETVLYSKVLDGDIQAVGMYLRHCTTSEQLRQFKTSERHKRKVADEQIKIAKHFRGIVEKDETNENPFRTGGGNLTLDELLELERVMKRYRYFYKRASGMTPEEIAAEDAEKTALLGAAHKSICLPYTG